MQSKPIAPPPIVIPEQKSGINRNILFVGIAGLVVLVGIGYWLFVLRSPDEIVVVTPTPTPIISATPTPTPTLKSIIVSDPIVVNIASSGKPQATIINAVKTSSIIGKKIQIIETKTTNGTVSTILKPDELLTKLSVAYPNVLKTVFSESDSHFYYYGQTETFSSKGILIPGSLPSIRIVIVSEVKDSAVTLASLRAWEATMAGDFNTLFEFNYKKNTAVTFLDNMYKGNSVRYVNFPWPDKSIDYAVVRASNAKQYLVITNSRESIFATLDQLILK